MLLGEENQDYFMAVSQLKNNSFVIQDVEKNFSHSPKEWHRAWLQLLAQRLTQPDKVMAARQLIYLQTQTTLAGEKRHHEAVRVYANQEPKIFRRLDLVADKHTTKVPEVKVGMTDCLEAVLSLHEINLMKVLV